MSTANTPPEAAAPAGFALFRQGLRPFFLICAIWAVVTVVLWLVALHGGGLPDGPLPGARWHGHEMLAGFVGAALSGFLLTAIPNWTGRAAYSGAPLALLAMLFVVARLVLLPGSPVPVNIAAPIALLPIPALLVTVLPALMRAATPRLLGPPGLLLAFWAGDVLMLGEAAGWWGGTFESGELLSLNVALLLVGLIGGRIIPAFTRNALRAAGQDIEPQPLPGVDTAGVAALLAVTVVDLVAPGGLLAGAAATAAAALAMLRLSRWWGLRTLAQPILWVLHLAYLMTPVALSVKAAYLLGDATWAANWLHLQGISAVGLMILAVMPRATLGHTGYPLRAPRAMVAAWLLLPVAAALRAFGPELLPGMLPFTAAGALWITAFGLFLAAHGPMLLWPRADGKPG